MLNMMKHFTNQAITVLCSASLVLFFAYPAMADDTEIFFGQGNSLPGNNPNILFIIDSSGSMRLPVDDDSRDRLKVVQDVAIDLISNLSNANVGLMKFDYHRGSSGDLASRGGMVVYPVSDVEDNLAQLTSEINRIEHVGYTPLSETYLEAALYMMGGQPFFGANSYEGYLNQYGYWRNRWFPSHSDSISGGNYVSPITGACQRNHIVYLSDGKPERDTGGTTRTNQLLSGTTYTDHANTFCRNTHGDTDGMCLDELADFLYKNDFSDEPGIQNVRSHFVAFNIELPIFEDSAEAGGGFYKTASNSDELTAVLNAIVNQVVEDNSGFTAPAVTVNAFDRTSHLDQLYFTVFKPSDNAHWAGNIKKYSFEEVANEDGLVIIGKDGSKAVNPATGLFYDGRNDNGELDANVPVAHSHWSALPDGADVTAGGAAALLDLGRHIITNPSGGSPGALIGNNIDSVAALTADLAAMHDPNKHELSVAQWIEWAAGIDIKDDDQDGSTSDARTQIGAPLHSKPAVVIYGGNGGQPELTLFVGTNDGYLHAIDGNTGQERFAFMPKELWKNIPALAENNSANSSLPYGIDGPITIHKNDGGDGVINGGSDFVHLYFGLRRGGNSYYALDVTNPDNPKMMWQFETSGQSWSTPTVAKVNLGTKTSVDERTVVFVGGGYNAQQDSHSTYQDDKVGTDWVGNSIHMLDAATGAELWSASNQNADLIVPQMKSSIPSTVRPLDMDLDGYVDRLYVNDIAGRLFRFDVHHDNETHLVTAGVIASVGGAATPASTNNRRFYYAPDIALGTAHGHQYLTITMGSGFRGHPLDKNINDHVLGVRDYNPFQRIGKELPADYDYGTDLSTMLNLSAINNSIVPPGSKGWYKPLSGPGEKSLSRSRIFQNKAYFTTYQPGGAPVGNPCAPAVGTGKLVTIDLNSGAITEKQLNKPGIPPEPTFIFGPGPLGQGSPTPQGCFGSDCPAPSPTNPEEDENKRDIECLIGPESCDAASDEVPNRTFWRHTDNS